MQYTWFGYSLGAVHLPLHLRSSGTGERLCPNLDTREEVSKGFLAQPTHISMIVSKSREH